jgi:hypothetical protein
LDSAEPRTHLPHGVRQRDEFPQCLGHVEDPLLSQPEPIKHRCGHVTALGVDQICRVCLEDLR